MLRSAQALGLAGGEQRRLRPVGPRQPLARRLENRAPFGLCDGEEAARPLDHDAARLAQGGAHQRDPGLAIPLCHRAHPFGPGPGLAEAAPGHDQPTVPAFLRRQLAIVGPQAPQGRDRTQLGHAELAHFGPALLGLERHQLLSRPHCRPPSRDLPPALRLLPRRRSGLPASAPHWRAAAGACFR